MVCCNEFDSKFVVHSNGYYSVFDINVGPPALWHFPITEDPARTVFVQGSQAVAFLPDSTLLVATYKCGIRRMDLISGEEIARLDDLESGFSNVTALAQSNSFVAVGTTATILILGFYSFLATVHFAICPSSFFLYFRSGELESDRTEIRCVRMSPGPCGQFARNCRLNIS
jgi:hypothetical protein